MRSLGGTILAVLALAPACRARPKPEPGPAPSAPSASGATDEAVAEPAPSASSMAARLMRCGWGSVKAEPGADAPPFAIALLDVEAPTPVKGLHVSVLELAAGDAVVAKMGGRGTVRVQEGAVSYS